MTRDTAAIASPKSDTATLTTFFDLDSAQVRKDGLAAFEGTAAFAGIKTLLTAAPALLQKHAADSVADALKAALDMRIVDILATAWNTRRELRQYLDRTKYPAGEIIDHALGKHEVRATHKPRLQIMLDNSPLGPEIEFDVAVALNLEAAVLRVQDGRIMFARLGKVFGTGTIKCEGATLFSRPTKAVVLPLTLSFGAGLAISKPEAQVADAA
jgi:hypothetical protein